MPFLADAALGLALTTGVAQPVGGGPCVVEGDALSLEDVATIGAICEAAHRRFADLLGDPAPRVLVMVQERSGYRIGILEGHAVVLWPRALVADSPSAGDPDPSDVLRHEIGHALTAARFFPDGRFEPTGYGTPLPDWFEEAVAIWAEPEASRANRLTAARRLPSERLDLRTILTMRHPAAGDAVALARRDGVVVPLDPELHDFYQQSLAVLAFLHAKGGEPAVRELARRLGERADGHEVLVGLPGLPAGFDEVEAAWASWLGQRTAD